jgi:type I restriction enzyme M protein
MSPSKSQAKRQISFLNDQPKTTPQKLNAIVKAARKLMRKDKGLSGELDRLPQLTWIMFLKFLDDAEMLREAEAELADKSFKPAIEAPYRWRDWAAPQDGSTGDDLLHFIMDETITLPDGTHGPGLFAYLRGLRGEDGRGDRRDVIGAVFRGVQNRMASGYILHEVIQKVNEINFTASEDIHTLSALYEGMLREMRDAAGDSGEFYTPRPVVRFMVTATDPRLGETVLDPASGTGGFLVEAYEHLKAQCRSVEDHRVLQAGSIRGQEAKPLPYLLCQMNLLLHGLEYPQIDSGNSLAVRLGELGEKDRVDVILTNPPFGGEEGREILSGFDQDKQTTETALLFLQLIMRRLRTTPRPGRAAVVVPNGILSGDGVSARIKEELLRDFNLHTIVRLPNGVFAPYTDIPTNLLFFERGGPTKEIWYYEQPLPPERRAYTKTRPLQFEEFADCLDWWKAREENERAWRIDFEKVYREAVAKAEPHWEAARRAEAQAQELTRQERALADRFQIVQRSLAKNNWQGTPDERLVLQSELEAIPEQRRQLQQQVDKLLQAARQEREQGDALYWPIYDLDKKNPFREVEEETQSPHELLEEILSNEQRILEIIKEVESLIKP